jgi:hypothetical protein
MAPLEVGWLAYVIMYLVTLLYTAVEIQVRIIYCLCIVIRILKHLFVQNFSLSDCYIWLIAYLINNNK